MSSWFSVVASRPRLVAAIALGAAVFLALPARFGGGSRFLAAWDAAAAAYLALAWRLMTRATLADMRQRAAREDERALTILVLTVAAAVVSLGAIAAEVYGARERGLGSSSPRIALAGATILVSWVFVHTMFALHYAHEYYGAPAGGREGLAFPKPGRDPDYWDFLYFAFTIGAASQTSDVTVVEHRMRRLVLAHTILSFLFNTTVLALAINVGASLI